MSETMLRNGFVAGTVLFFAILFGMTFDSLAQVSATRTPALTDAVVAGKQVWQSKNCDDCHTILGIGGYYAPELTKVMQRRGEPWIRSWLKDPQAVIPGTTMPNQQLSPADIDNLVAFFTWVGGIDTNGWPPAPVGQGNTGSTGPSGSLLFAQKGCSGCHRINGQGATGPGPDLSHIGSQPYDALPNTPEFLKLWLANPAAQKPGTIMPKLPLTQADIDALVQYLVSLK